MNAAEIKGSGVFAQFVKPEVDGFWITAPIVEWCATREDAEGQARDGDQVFEVAYDTLKLIYELTHSEFMKFIVEDGIARHIVRDASEIHDEPEWD